MGKLEKDASRQIDQVPRNMWFWAVVRSDYRPNTIKDLQASVQKGFWARPKLARWIDEGPVLSVSKRHQLVRVAVPWLASSTRFCRTITLVWKVALARRAQMDFRICREQILGLRVVARQEPPRVPEPARLPAGYRRVGTGLEDRRFRRSIAPLVGRVTIRRGGLLWQKPVPARKARSS
jgi:hypothetical protein